MQGPKTANLLSVWGDTLTSARIRDALGHESDTCTLTFRVSPPFEKKDGKTEGGGTAGSGTMAGDPRAGMSPEAERR
ncbi:hypothetical protein DFO45_4851 [Azorhizobium sp. AG788]|uniref:hypothetical protein n=1 Tax=Azorhizobium sp. AG788 TaxID=2183897 RepID=UPI00105C26C1|nr:hypothetical protein [Azorhizobium sp. AG788]TDT88063.1 hypothetical protein DFO45_4851 [Azorhizobium sp. AG788]